MPTSLPLSLVISWALFFAFFLAQGHHERVLKASPFMESPRLVRAIGISISAGLLTGVVILGYYLFRVTWYWPVALAVVGSVLGSLTMGLLSGLMGVEALSKRAFIGMPLCAVWALGVIHELP